MRTGRLRSGATGVATAGVITALASAPVPTQGQRVGRQYFRWGSSESQRSNPSANNNADRTSRMRCEDSAVTSEPTRPRGTV